MQAITDQFAACQYCTKLFATELYARLAPSLHKIQPKVGFGQTTVLKTIWWCTEYRSNDAVSGVYRCTSPQ